MFEPMARVRLRWVIAVALAGAGSWTGPAMGAEGGEAWLTGLALEKRLAEPLDELYWSGLPLRQALYRLGAKERVAMLLDRRIDPDQKIELTLKETPLEEVLDKIAQRAGAGISRVGSVVYLGPPEDTANLRTLVELRREDVRQLPPPAAARLMRMERLAWADLATPRGLLEQLAQKGEIELPLDPIPHDLWGAAELPPLPLVDRLSLIAFQFHRTLQFSEDGRRASLVEIPAEVGIVRSYPAGKQSSQLAARLGQLVPQARIKTVGDRVFVKARVEDHQRILGQQGTRRPAGQTPSAKSLAAPGEKRYTLAAAKGSLGGLLRGLAARFELELKLDERGLREAGISMDQPVTLSAKEATREGLFEALLAPHGCSFRIEGGVLSVEAAGRRE